MLEKIKRNQRISFPSDVLIKENLGCGLAAAPAWVNIDASLSALAVILLSWLHSAAYHLTATKNNSDKEEDLSLFRGHRFVHDDLSYGLGAN